MWMVPVEESEEEVDMDVGIVACLEDRRSRKEGEAQQVALARRSDLLRDMCMAQWMQECMCRTVVLMISFQKFALRFGLISTSSSAPPQQYLRFRSEIWNK